MLRTALLALFAFVLNCSLATAALAAPGLSKLYLDIGKKSVEVTAQYGHADDQGRVHLVVARDQALTKSVKTFNEKLSDVGYFKGKGGRGFGLKVKGLKEKTTYYFKITVEDGSGKRETPVLSFKTKGPNGEETGDPRTWHYDGVVL